MKFVVLALDYDGTIAHDGVLDPEVRAAIGEARALWRFFAVGPTDRCVLSRSDITAPALLAERCVGRNALMINATCSHGSTYTHTDLCRIAKITMANGFKVIVKLFYKGDAGGNVQVGYLIVRDILQVLHERPQAVAVGHDQ